MLRRSPTRFLSITVLSTIGQYLVIGNCFGINSSHKKSAMQQHSALVLVVLWPRWGADVAKQGALVLLPAVDLSFKQCGVFLGVVCHFLCVLWSSAVVEAAVRAVSDLVSYRDDSRQAVLFEIRTSDTFQFIRLLHASECQVKLVLLMFLAPQSKTERPVLLLDEIRLCQPRRCLLKEVDDNLPKVRRRVVWIRHEICPDLLNSFNNFIRHRLPPILAV